MGSQLLGDKLVAGAAWMAAMRLSVRGIGLINTLILARLLTPDDFGVVAMAMVVVAFVSSFNDLGLDMALIRTQHLTADHYHSAWTLTVIIGVFSSTMLALAATYIADFYMDPRLFPVMYAMAALPLINSLSNVRLADFRRDLNFSKDFKYHLVSRIIVLPATIGLALYFQNYWALVVGILSQGISALIVGYLMRPFRPRFSFVAIRELFGFSVWIQIRSIGQVLNQRIDQLYAGKLFGTHELGGYHISQEIAEMATNQLVVPFGRALLPGYSRMRGQDERLRSVFLRVLGLHVTLAVALASGLYTLAPGLVEVLLGNQWIEFIDIFQILAVAGGVAAITSAIEPPLIALGRVRELATSVWIRLGFNVLALSAIAIWSRGLEAVALARLVVNFVPLIALLGVLLAALNGRVWDVLVLFFRPILSASLMVIAITIFQSCGVDLAWLKLVLEVSLGAFVYSAGLLGFWWAAGRPEGVEKEIISRAALMVARRRSANRITTQDP